MPYTREEVVREAEEFLRRDAIRIVLEEMPIAKRLEGVPAAKRLEGLTQDEHEQLRQLLAEQPSTEAKE